MKRATAYIDGSGNSARIQACATAIFLDGGCHERTKLLPPHTTNNVGEYNGLLLAIELAIELGVEILTIRSDSLLIVEQTNGNWRCKNPDLRKLRDQIWEKAQTFQKVILEWVPREENSLADGLCRQAIKEAEITSK
jgi:ribonuclease HI